MILIWGCSLWTNVDKYELFCIDWDNESNYYVSLWYAEQTDITTLKNKLVLFQSFPQDLEDSRENREAEYFILLWDKLMLLKIITFPCWAICHWSLVERGVGKLFSDAPSGIHKTIG